MVRSLGAFRFCIVRTFSYCFEVVMFHFLSRFSSLSDFFQHLSSDYEINDDVFSFLNNFYIYCYFG